MAREESVRTGGMRTRSSRLGRLAAVLVLGLNALGAPAQQGTGPGRSDAAEARLTAGRTALRAGDGAAATLHLIHALELRPDSVEILALLIEAAQDDADARTLWTHEWYAAAAGADGRAKPSGAARAVLADDPHIARIATARAAVVGELAGLAAARAKKGARAPGELLVALWARRVALELARGVPALEDGVAGDLDPRLTVSRTFHDAVIKALRGATGGALARFETDVAMRGARCLHGLAVQADFKDLQGPEPRGMGRVRGAAAQALARARDQLAKKIGAPWTIAELEWLTSDEGEAFTREHDSFGSPGVALSPREWYRVESDCGYETLLGVARTIEEHHTRLANWYGEDPFVGRQGTVRIVPESSGLESEGAPFWWAGGFQGGDTTTMRFSIGTIEGLGHGLTHELTHRFDGALFPGQPSWLVEGKAVWTGGAYGRSSDTNFVADFAVFGPIEKTFRKGYGGLKKLTELIEGEIEEYRDNYFAGYALYVYLSSWEEGGERIFAERLQEFMANARQSSKNPKAYFEKHFADGRGGRPEDLEAFAAGFATFVKGFYWKDRQPWTKRYVTGVAGPKGAPLVYDEPTWVWSRGRAEPYFGDDQARIAGELLLEIGKDVAALRALVWAASADGRHPAVERALATVLDNLRRRDAAWAFACMRAFPFGAVARRAPFETSLHDAKALLRALGGAVSAYSEAGLDVAAAAVAADHDRLAARLGAEALTLPAPTGAAACRFPFDAPGRYAGWRGWEEDGLTGYEDFRVPDLWYAADDGDLHVGRKRPRTGTGRLDRAAHQRHAFVRTRDWLLPGTYRIRMDVQFTTSYVSGAVILGYTRRDRNVRFGFTAGDFMYAIGESEDEPKFEEVSWSLRGLFQRDGALAGSVPRGTHAFGKPRSGFKLELLVDGATAHVFIDGEYEGTYHPADGMPIEGTIGFATSFGAVRIGTPIVQRLDRTRRAGLFDPALGGLDLGREQAVPFDDLENRPVRGLPPSPNGTILVWIPAPDVAAGETYEDTEKELRRTVKNLWRLLDREDATQPAIVAVPASLGAERSAALARELSDEAGRTLRLVPHAFTGLVPEGAEEPPDEFRRWLMFLDPGNVARVVLPFFGQATVTNGRLRHWLTVFRDHGRPPRELPPVPRVGEQDDGD